MNKISKEGFTLIEVLIAVFLLSVGMMAVAGMMTTALRAGSYGRASTVANRLVQQQMEQVRSVTFSTAVNSMCGLGVPQPAGFSGACATVVTDTAFVNRTSSEYTIQYSIPGGDPSNLSNVVYSLTMQKVKNYPMEDVDMISIKAEWTDKMGSHASSASTYMER